MAGRILIADGAATNRIILKVKLAAARYAVTAVPNAIAARAAALDVRPDLIILDERLPDRSGTDLCQELKSAQETRDIPVVIITDGSSSDARLAALDAGADEFLSTPVDELTLLARVRSLLRAKETRDALRRRQSTVAELGFAEEKPRFEPPGRVVLVARDQKIAQSWRDSLAPMTRHVVETKSIGGALSDANRPRGADVFVIAADLEHPGEGLRLLAELRSRPGTRHAAILMVHERTNIASAVTALDLGANDLVPAGFDPTELALRIKTQLARKRDDDALRDAVDEGLRLAVLDPLTGLFNRRYAMAHGTRLMREVEDRGGGLAVILADVDRFKRVNDSYGHAVGDMVLTEVARRLRENLRGADLIARIGGEEFLIVLPDVDASIGYWTAQRLCKSVSDSGVSVGADKKPIPVTISLGLATTDPSREPQSLEALIERADKALYRAKSEGRNKVTMGRTAA